jgi:hypothetical protein
MFRPLAAVALSAILTALALPGSAPAQETPQKQAKKESQSKAASSKTAALTGCVDEQDGHYVLVDDRALTPVAVLEAEGFPPEGFAKHMGHKVTVRGVSNHESPRPIFKVRSIETVSETCVPQSER